MTERTREIGVRKAVGATNRQILNQFLTEAAILSLAGGFLGIIVSLVVDYAIALFTDIVPAITFPIMGIALVLALAVGVFFGITPALKAASKRPHRRSSIRVIFRLLQYELGGALMTFRLLFCVFLWRLARIYPTPASSTSTKLSNIDPKKTVFCTSKAQNY